MSSKQFPEANLAMAADFQAYEAFYVAGDEGNVGEAFAELCNAMGITDTTEIARLRSEGLHQLYRQETEA